MARPVYSVQFLLGNDDSALPSFEVPDGYTAVIRQVTAYASSELGALYVIIQDTVSAPQVVVALLTLAGEGSFQAFECRVAVPEHGIISLQTIELGSGVEFYVGGYLLANGS